MVVRGVAVAVSTLKISIFVGRKNRYPAERQVLFGVTEKHRETNREAAENKELMLIIDLVESDCPYSYEHVASHRPCDAYCRWVYGVQIFG